MKEGQTSWHRSFLVLSLSRVSGWCRSSSLDDGKKSSVKRKRERERESRLVVLLPRTCHYQRSRLSKRMKFNCETVEDHHSSDLFIDFTHTSMDLSWHMFVLVSCLLTSISFIHGQPFVLHIGAFFNSDFYDLQAAQLAIEEINLRSAELFDNRFRLTLLSNHSRVNRFSYLL